jgi:hypothetical protein
MVGQGMASPRAHDSFNSRCWPLTSQDFERKKKKLGMRVSLSSSHLYFDYSEVMKLSAASLLAAASFVGAIS